MTGAFDYFVIFAEMRTGSNFLETNLNAFDGIACRGEAFNPHFIGYPNRSDLLAISRADRDTNPTLVIDAIRDDPTALSGFRFFHDHDPRVLEPILEDQRCAKIILTRNPLDSYVSWKIAQETGQWKLTDVKRRKDAKARFDGDEFARHVEALQDFQVFVLNQLQTTGQTAFYIAYEDLQNVAVINGLARWLGVDAELDSLDKSLKPQNPAPLISKVSNPDDLVTGLAELDRFNLNRTPNFEPRRGPSVPTYVAAVNAPLLYMPVRSGPEAEVVQWLAALDGVNPADLLTKANQKQLRQWKKTHPGHRSFTVLRHPVARAHAAFCQYILDTGPNSFEHIRATLKKQFKLPLPKGQPDASYTRAIHREAFEGYLRFVRANLAGQTGIRVDPVWASQAQILSGFGDMVLPDLLVRETEMADLLPALAERVGATAIAPPSAAPDPGPFAVSDIYDDALEAMVAEAYQKDYQLFGFEDWSADQAA